MIGAGEELGCGVRALWVGRPVTGMPEGAPSMVGSVTTAVGMLVGSTGIPLPVVGLPLAKEPTGLPLVGDETGELVVGLPSEPTLGAPEEMGASEEGTLSWGAPVLVNEGDAATLAVGPGVSGDDEGLDDSLPPPVSTTVPTVVGDNVFGVDVVDIDGILLEPVGPEVTMLVGVALGDPGVGVLGLMVSVPMGLPEKLVGISAAGLEVTEPFVGSGKDRGEGAPLT